MRCKRERYITGKELKMTSPVTSAISPPVMGISTL